MNIFLNEVQFPIFSFNFWDKKMGERKYAVPETSNKDAIVTII